MKKTIIVIHMILVSFLFTNSIHAQSSWINAPQVVENGAVVSVTVHNLQPGDTASLSIDGSCRIFAAKNTGSKVIKSISTRIKLEKKSFVILSINGHAVSRRGITVLIGAGPFLYGPTVCMSSLSDNGNSYKALKQRSNDFKVRAIGSVKKGLSTIKTLITNPMETGLRKNRRTGRKIPAHYIENGYVGINGREALRLYFQAGLSKNPYLKVVFADGRAGEVVDIVVVDNKGKVGVGTPRVRR